MRQQTEKTHYRPLNSLPANNSTTQKLYHEPIPISDHLLDMLQWKITAHISFDHAIQDFPLHRAGEKVKGLDHSMWMLIEHIRIVNRDLIDWATAKNYTPRQFP